MHAHLTDNKTYPYSVLSYRMGTHTGSTPYKANDQDAYGRAIEDTIGRLHRMGMHTWELHNDYTGTEK